MARETLLMAFLRLGWLTVESSTYIVEHELNFFMWCDSIKMTWLFRCSFKLLSKSVRDLFKNKGPVFGFEDGSPSMSSGSLSLMCCKLQLADGITSGRWGCWWWWETWNTSRDDDLLEPQSPSPFASFPSSSSLSRTTERSLLRLDLLPLFLGATLGVVGAVQHDNLPPIFQHECWGFSPDVGWKGNLASDEFRMQ